MRRVWLGIFLFALVVAVFFFDRSMGRSSILAEKVNDLNNLQQKQVDVSVQVTSLLAGFATLSLGGIGALIWDRKKLGKPPTTQLLIAASGCALSLYFGYLSYRYLLWMLAHQFFDLSSTFVTLTGYFQFGTFFLSLVALADFVLAVD
jgi:hypothetical protein